jgi:hypothetical protein
MGARAARADQTRDGVMPGCSVPRDLDRPVRDDFGEQADPRQQDVAGLSHAYAASTAAGQSAHAIEGDRHEHLDCCRAGEQRGDRGVAGVVGVVPHTGACARRRAGPGRHRPTVLGDCRAGRARLRPGPPRGGRALARRWPDHLGRTVGPGAWRFPTARRRECRAQRGVAALRAAWALLEEAMAAAPPLPRTGAPRWRPGPGRQPAPRHRSRTHLRAHDRGTPPATRRSRRTTRLPCSLCGPRSPRCWARPRQACHSSQVDGPPRTRSVAWHGTSSTTSGRTTIDGRRTVPR